MKLYQKDIDKEIERYTVGDDYLLDENLLVFDIKASIAHAKMLGKIGILSSDETKKLVNALQSIVKLEIHQDDEDVHTAIENFLVKKLGDLGKKIHTGRSRNDQVTVAMRLYTKEHILEAQSKVKDLINEMNNFAQKNNYLLPGYTHMQKAMPSSISMWIAGYVAALSDCLWSLSKAYDLTDQNPLGSAAGYGTNLDLDKNYTSKLLGFSKEQVTTYVQLSRGLIESESIFVLSQIMDVVAKLSTDLLLFTTSEFDYFSLPDSFVTGSSIMPQKKNYDVFELARAKSKVVFGNLVTVKSLSSSLPSGYNRDFQLLKKPLFDSFDTTISTLSVFKKVFENLIVNKKKISDAMTPELYATEKAYALVKKGIPFRDAYMEVKKEFE